MNQEDGRGCPGQPKSEVHRRKLSEALKGHPSPNRGVPRSEELRKRLSEIAKHLGLRPPSQKGKKLGPFSEEHIHRLSLAGKLRTGPQTSNWKGGVSFEPYPVSWTEQLKESIRTRDHHVCQLCDKKQEDLTEKLHVHHIDYDKKNLDPENLISLCRSCHSKTNYNRKHWIPVLTGRINENR